MKATGIKLKNARVKLYEHDDGTATLVFMRLAESRKEHVRMESGYGVLMKADRGIAQTEIHISAEAIHALHSLLIHKARRDERGGE